MHHKLGEAREEEEVEYHDIALAEYEGELVRQLNAAGILTKEEYHDFQGVCYHTPPRELKANTVTPHRSAQAQDDLSRLGGHFPAFKNQYGCQKLVVTHKLNLPDSKATQSGEFDGPCDSGSWTLSRIPGVKLFLLVIDERRENPIPRVDNTPEKPTFSVSCHISNAIHRPGSFHNVRDSCSRYVGEDVPSKLLPPSECFFNLEVPFECRLVAPAAKILWRWWVSCGLALVLVFVFSA